MTPAEPDQPFILRIPGERFRAAKTAMVEAARLRNQRLAAWMVDALERQAHSDLEDSTKENPPAIG